MIIENLTADIAPTSNASGSQVFDGQGIYWETGGQLAPTLQADGDPEDHKIVIDAATYPSLVARNAIQKGERRERTWMERGA